MVKVQWPAAFGNSGEENVSVPLLVVVPDWVTLTDPLQAAPRATDPTREPVTLLALVVMVMLHL
jgi:hypothetical protein